MILTFAVIDLDLRFLSFLKRGFTNYLFPGLTDLIAIMFYHSPLINDTRILFPSFLKELTLLIIGLRSPILGSSKMYKPS